MLEIIKMFVVLTLISTVSGFSLSLVHEGTKSQIEYTELNVVYAPKIKMLVEGYDNDPIKDVKKIVAGKNKKGKEIIKNVFPCKKNGEIFALALDSAGTGFGGNITVLVAIDVKTDTIKGVGVLMHTETKGIGTSLEAPYLLRFMGLPAGEPVDLKARGGKIDGMSGASYSSIGIMDAAREGLAFYNSKKDEILSAVK